jgi:hypothetical protein
MEAISKEKLQKIARIIFATRKINYIPIQRIQRGYIDHNNDQFIFHLITGGTLVISR